MVFYILFRGGGGVFVVIGGCGTAEDEVGEEMILHQYLVLFPGQPAIQRDISYEQATLTRNTCIAYPSSRPGIKSHGVHSTIAIVVTTQASSRAGTTKAGTHHEKCVNARYLYKLCSCLLPLSSWLAAASIGSVDLLVFLHPPFRFPFQKRTLAITPTH